MFIFSGLVIGIKSSLKDLATAEVDIGFQLIGLAFSGLGSLIAGKYAISPIIFGLGKLLKGKSELIDIRTVVAYSQIPFIFTLPIILYLGLNDRYAHLTGIELWLVNTVNVIVWILSTNICIRGLTLYNNYGIGKAFLNLTSFWLIAIAWWVYYLLVILP